MQRDDVLPASLLILDCIAHLEPPTILQRTPLVSRAVPLERIRRSVSANVGVVGAVLAGVARGTCTQQAVSGGAKAELATVIVHERVDDDLVAPIKARQGGLGQVLQCTPAHR